jgi:hypothetical protein
MSRVARAHRVPVLVGNQSIYLIGVKSKQPVIALRNHTMSSFPRPMSANRLNIFFNMQPQRQRKYVVVSHSTELDLKSSTAVRLVYIQLHRRHSEHAKLTLIYQRRDGLSGK